MLICAYRGVFTTESPMGEHELLMLPKSSRSPPARNERATGQHDDLAAFLSPTLVKAAIDGRLPLGIGIARLRDAPAEWSRQHTANGLAS
ncbi:MAG: hypothetical protein ACM3Z4_02530 [Hyphomicrobiales bacterium]